MSDRGNSGRERMLTEVVEHYEQQLRRHGPTAEGMDWKDEASQALRFEVLCGICDLEGRSVHEIGAGAGHLADFLCSKDVKADYSGSDASREMVEAARLRHPDLRFDCRELPDPTPETRRYDVLLCSGLFHVKLRNSEEQWWAFVRQTLRRMFGSCRIGIAFNLMSDQVDYRSPDLFYAKLGQTLDFCRHELSRRVALRHDYPLYEYTVYVYRDEAES